jgi:hypothetical protein
MYKCIDICLCKCLYAGVNIYRSICKGIFFHLYIYIVCQFIYVSIRKDARRLAMVNAAQDRGKVWDKKVAAGSRRRKEGMHI